MPTPTYHLFVDDSGSRFIDRPSTPRNDGMDYFAMGGILIKAEEARQTTVDLDKICEKYSINYPLHSTKIRSKRKNGLGWETKNKRIQLIPSWKTLVIFCAIFQDMQQLV